MGEPAPQPLYPTQARPSQPEAEAVPPQPRPHPPGGPGAQARLHHRPTLCAPVPRPPTSEAIPVGQSGGSGGRGSSGRAGEAALSKTVGWVPTGGRRCLLGRHVLQTQPKLLCSPNRVHCTRGDPRPSTEGAWCASCRVPSRTRACRVPRAWTGPGWTLENRGRAGGCPGLLYLRLREATAPPAGASRRGGGGLSTPCHPSRAGSTRAPRDAILCSCRRAQKG